MADWLGYFVIERITDNLNEENWILLIDEVRRILTSGTRCHEVLRSRPNMKDPVYYDAYIYAANFPEQAVSFDKFADKLADAFDVDVQDVSYTETPGEYGVQAAYKYGANDRFYLTLMGCAADDDLCSWHDSNVEAKLLAAEWDVL